MRGSLLLTALLPACASAPLADGRGVGAAPSSPMTTASSPFGDGRGGGGAEPSADEGDGGSGAEPRPEARELVARALTFDLAEPVLGDVAKSLWATYYYVPRVAELATGFALRDMEGRSLGATLSRRDWCEAAMEGTVVVERDGGTATFNYAGTRKNTEVDCTSVYPKHPAIGRTRYTLAIGPFGDGVRDMILIPFRSIAVDPKEIPFGSLVYVPAARGVELTLPDGSAATHDGYFFAADRGGAIKNVHIDVFVGVGNDNPFPFVKSKSTATFAAHVIPRDRAEAAHRRLTDAHAAFADR